MVASTVSKKTEPLAGLPTVPSVEAWRAMTPEQRLDFQIRVNDALSDPVLTESRAHKKAKSRAIERAVTAATLAEVIDEPG